MDQTEVKSRYAGKAEEEWNRLTTSPIARIEYLINRHSLECYLPPSGWILDVGSGPGRYALDLAGLGYRVIMFDLVFEMLQLGQTKVAQAGLNQQVTCVTGDMVALPYRSSTFDAVISLGAPLSHFTQGPLRAATVAEMVRVVKPGGPVLLTGLTRLAHYRASVFWLKYHPEFIKKLLDSEFRVDGISLGSQCWYTFAPGELETLAQSSGLQVVDRIGCEGLANHLPLENLELVESMPDYWSAWKEILLETCREPSIIGISNHFLVVGRK
jgi:SAM-dependent methyltransferase